MHMYLYICVYIYKPYSSLKSIPLIYIEAKRKILIKRIQTLYSILNDVTIF
jgi:hypothetical protein